MPCDAGQGLAGGVSAIVVGLCCCLSVCTVSNGSVCMAQTHLSGGVIFAHRVYPLFVFFLGCVLGGKFGDQARGYGKSQALLEGVPLSSAGAPLAWPVPLPL